MYGARSACRPAGAATRHSNCSEADDAPGIRRLARPASARAPLDARGPHRAAVVGNILRNGTEIADQLILSRCTRGADIARSLRFSEAVCEGIYRLDEHWDGSGRPEAQSGAAIALYARIALLAQIADVFHSHAGPSAAIDEVQRRSGTWLDPELCRAFADVAASPAFWTVLTSPTLDARMAALAPLDASFPVDEDYLDAIAGAFGQVIDAKSPFTAGHSGRVGDLASTIGAATGLSPERTRWLRRGALLHDIGKLGVSNTILDKPAGLSADEWEVMRNHACHTQEISGGSAFLPIWRQSRPLTTNGSTAKATHLASAGPRSVAKLASSPFATFTTR